MREGQVYTHSLEELSLEDLDGVGVEVVLVGQFNDQAMLLVKLDFELLQEAGQLPVLCHQVPPPTLLRL